ncbi:MAG: S8 family serine peptidase, partial [Anaerolineae bacterium]|nr:S8 family serine peptidase [Anaerolineae bacterium]
MTGAVRHPALKREIVVMTFDEATPAQEEELGRLMTIEGRSTGPIHFVEGRARGASILALTRLDYVSWVEERGEAELGNLDGGMGVGADVVRAAGFDGTGVQVMVVDSGIAREGDTYHPDLLGDRILDQWDYYRNDGIAEDEYYLGHGTHVAGTIGGRHNPGDAQSNESYHGVAPGASFLIYKLFGPLPQSILGWFGQALDRATSDPLRAHVSSNSWGGDNGAYNAYSEIADSAVRGEFNGAEVNFVAAAMNDDDYVSAPGTGKNVITVGAVKDGNYPDILLPSLGYGCGPDNWPPGERLCYSNHGPIDTDGD